MFCINKTIEHFSNKKDFSSSVNILNHGKIDMATPRKRKQLTIDQKCEIIQAVEKKTKSKTEIAKNCGINPSTLTEILKRKDLIITVSQSGDFSPIRKQIRLGVHEDVENALCKWFMCL